MGRAIVRQPQVFLMDEPLSNLDAKLRVQMRAEITRLQARARRDDDLRHARPGRGDDDGRPDRRHAQGRAPAAGAAGAALRRARQPLRRRVHRLARDEPLPGRDSTDDAVVLGDQRLPLPPSVLAERPRSPPTTGARSRSGIRPEHLVDARRPTRAATLRGGGAVHRGAAARAARLRDDRGAAGRDR